MWLGCRNSGCCAVMPTKLPSMLQVRVRVDTISVARHMPCVACPVARALYISTDNTAVYCVGIGSLTALLIKQPQSVSDTSCRKHHSPARMNVMAILSQSDQ